MENGMKMVATGMVRRFAPSQRRKEQAQYYWPLSLPVADAARLAGPDLHPHIERLCVQRIAVSPRHFGPNRTARFLRVHARLLHARARNSGSRSHDAFGLDDPGRGLRLSARLRALALLIGFRLDRNPREL